jgi:hypothetical protein
MNDAPFLLIVAFTIWKLIDVGWVGFLSLVGLQTNLGTKNRRITDVSSLQLTPPPLVQRIIQSLQGINFQRLGEAQLKLPFRPALTTWVLVDDNQQVQAETALGRVSFSSFFHENILVVTDYPNGEHIETPTYKSHTVTTNLNDAYLHHLKQVEKFGQKYGTPNSIRTMSDYYRGETMGRVYPYARLKLRRFIWVETVRFAVFVYGMLSLILEMLLYWHKPSFLPANFPYSKETIEAITLIFTSSVLFVPDIFHRWMIKRTYRNSADR